MAKDPDHPAGSFETENTGGVLSGLLAEEDVFDRRAMWRLGSWGFASVGAVILAVLANQSSIGSRRDQFAAVDLARQAQQIQSIAKDSQNETRRLSSAIDTLNGDRDRLYSRVTVLEQGLDSVTGAIARQNSTAAASPALPAVPPQAVSAAEPQAVAAPTAPLLPAPAQNQIPAPVVSPVATTPATAVEKPLAEAKPPEPAPSTVSSVGKSALTPVATPPAATPATPLVTSKSLLAPPDSEPAKLIEPEKPADSVAAAAVTPEAVASVISEEPEPSEATAPQQVARTEFGIDIGGANSVEGLRALWRGLLKSKSNAALLTLHPIIVVKEISRGFGMQLRLVAGPLGDAAAAARICAAMVENERPCATTVFDGQRLAMKAEDQPAAAKPVVPAAKPAASVNRRNNAKRAASDDAAKKPETSTLSSMFGRH